MEIRFSPLFSGSSGNSLYVGAEDTHLLIDAGVSGTRVIAEMNRIGVDPGALSGILITHEHSDHISGAGVLSRKFDLPIYATAGTWAGMEKKLGNIPMKNVRMIDSNHDFYLGPLDILPFSIPHDAQEPVGYVFESYGAKVAVATDMGYMQKAALTHISGADMLLLESNYDEDMLKAGSYPYDLKKRILSKKGHMSNDEASRAAVQLYASGVKHIMLGHLSKENNFPELAFESTALALREAGIVPGEDVSLSVAQRSACSGLYAIRTGFRPEALSR